MIKYFIIIFLFLTSCQQVEKETVHKEKKIERYQEEHRPQFHFSPEHSWMNDPNGMVYYNDEYHLFYQYYPDSTVWGPMHWGHAVSKNLIHWEHLPIALYPDSLGYIFSGSAVVDWYNTSGFGINGEPPIVAIFTHHDIEGEKKGTKKFQYQSIAYSTDQGRSFTKFTGNPVIPNPGIKDFRDPKVVWHEPSEHWIMVFAAYDKVMIYRSPNLKDWTYASEFGIQGDQRLWECPDLFSMSVEGTTMEKWVLITSIQKEGPNGGTASSYFVGDFDGISFKGNSADQKWLDYGKDNYAMVTWSDIPEKDGRRIALGWMSNWQYAQQVPTEKWRSAMTLPRTLSLHESNGDYTLSSEPVRELAKLEGLSAKLESQKINGSLQVANELSEHLYKLELSFKKPKKGLVEVRCSNTKGEMLSIGFNSGEEAYFIDRTFAGKDDFSDVFADYHTAPLNYKEDQIDMIIYLDVSSVELFADAGKTVMTDIFFPTEPYSIIEIIAETNEVELISGSVTQLKPIW